MEKYGKTAVFPGGYGRIGEIPQGRLWPDWGLRVKHLFLFMNILIRSSPKMFVAPKK